MLRRKNGKWGGGLPWKEADGEEGGGVRQSGRRRVAVQEKKDAGIKIR